MGLSHLTDEQALAAAHPAPRLYIEAAPGSGKTTVAAARFVVHRFSPEHTRDPRAVVAVSFTRSASSELFARVKRNFGSGVMTGPHRVQTIDAFIADLVQSLLRASDLVWPGGITELEIHDTWKALIDCPWSLSDARVSLEARHVKVRRFRHATRRTSKAPSAFKAAINNGICTHEDVRHVLEDALANPDIRAAVVDRLRATVRSLIVDEIFDANNLDLALVEIAVEAGTLVTIIGDPWQALYGFRDARPDLVPELVSNRKFATRELLHSFRWRTEAQSQLASRLRARNGVVILPTDLGTHDVDVVLASTWQSLWDTNDMVLPLAFKSAKGNGPEAAATLLLGRFTEDVLGLSATYAQDAMTTLRLGADVTTDDLAPALREALGTLGSDSVSAVRDTYIALASVVSAFGGIELPKVHGAYTKRLAALQGRLLNSGRLIPGMTTHQAKGREWERVGTAWTSAEEGALTAGLDPTNEAHRKIYVGCTRARVATVGIPPS